MAAEEELTRPVISGSDVTVDSLPGVLRHLEPRRLRIEERLSRRRLLRASAAGLAPIAGRFGYAQTPSSPPADHTIRIDSVSLEIAPGKVITTTGCNGTVPGPALRVQEGRPVAINVINDSGYPDLIHWHGLFIPSVQDRATEEGSPIIPPETRCSTRLRPGAPARVDTTAMPWL
jgi:FtsP/CotA-like multicopper oxidase with cupredoxin domain